MPALTEPSSTVNRQQLNTEIYSNYIFSQKQFVLSRFNNELYSRITNYCLFYLDDQTI